MIRVGEDQSDTDWRATTPCGPRPGGCRRVRPLIPAPLRLFCRTVSVNSRKWTICSRRQSRPQSWGEAEGVRQTHPAHRSEGSKLDRMNPKIWPHYYVMTVNKHLFLAFVKEPSLPIRWKACWKEQCPWMELSFLQSHKQEITHIPIFNSVIQGRKHWLKRNRQKQKLILSLS